MTIKEEFEKAFEEEFDQYDSQDPITAGEKETALWAAKWMAERCAKKMDGAWADYINQSPGDSIRQLAKSLEE